MYKVLWNHLDQNLKKAPAPAVFSCTFDSWMECSRNSCRITCLSGTSDRTDGEADCDLMCRWIRRTDSRFLRWDLLSLPNGSSETFCGSCS